MKRLKETLKIIFRSSIVKYVVVVVVGIVIVGLMDENSVRGHLNNKQKINELKEEIEYHRRNHERDESQLRALDTDPKTVEKIARERYFMKRADEDIFVINDN